MAFFNEFPFTRTYDSDLAWLIRRMKEVLAKMDRVDEILTTIEELLAGLPQTIRDEVTRQLLDMLANGDFDQYFQSLMNRPDKLVVTTHINTPNFTKAITDVVFTVYGAFVHVDMFLTWEKGTAPSYNGQHFLLDNTALATWYKPNGEHAENINVMNWFNERFDDIAFNLNKYALSGETDEIFSNTVSNGNVQGVGGYVGIRSERTNDNMFRLSLTRFTQANSDTRFHYSGFLSMARKIV